MNEIVKYDAGYEVELLSLLKSEPDWNSFTAADALESFKSALLNSETFIYKSDNVVYGYIRALVDAFGVYISELYVAPSIRNKGFGKALLATIKDQHPDQEVYVLSDEDLYYQKLGCKRVGSVFQI